MKYWVIKTDEARDALNPTDKERLLDIFHYINDHRSKLGKNKNHYLVVNIDEPYAGKVADMIETEERRKGTWEYGKKSMREILGIK